MTYIIAEPCVSTCDTACIEVCPVDCIHIIDPIGGVAEWQWERPRYTGRDRRNIVGL